MGAVDRDADDQRLLGAWRREESRPAVGWDFSHLQGRMTEDQPSWDFDALCRQALKFTRHVLDMGTGGGEQLLTFADVLPEDTVATEGWPPNLPVARAALAPHGIPVVAYDPESAVAADRRMPFGDGRFDLVLNRHEAFVAEEVARVLAPGGVFLTQQVAGDDARELHEWLGGQASYPAHLKDQLVGQVRAAGLVIEVEAEWTGAYRFDDVAALVAYLRQVPWDAPDDFTVDRYADRLLALHRDHHGGPLTVTKRRFWFRACKP
jgi:SAM-dependent methyltransferase